MPANSGMRTGQVKQTTPKKGVKNSSIPRTGKSSIVNGEPHAGKRGGKSGVTNPTIQRGA